MTAIRILLLLIFAALALVELAWQQIGHFNIDTRLYGGTMILVLGFMAGAFHYDRVHRDSCVSSLLFGLGFVFATTANLNIINYFDLTVMGPRIDNLLVAMDRTIGINWPASMAFASDLPKMNIVLLFAYEISVWLVTPIQGGHHVVHMIGGFVVLAFAIWHSTILARRLAAVRQKNETVPALVAAG